jgi:hypothetical protein
VVTAFDARSGFFTVTWDGEGAREVFLSHASYAARVGARAAALAAALLGSCRFLTTSFVAQSRSRRPRRLSSSPWWSRRPRRRPRRSRRRRGRPQQQQSKAAKAARVPLPGGIGGKSAAQKPRRADAARKKAK